MRARESVHSRKKGKERRRRGGRKRKGKGSGRERKKRGEQIRAPPRREARGLCALRFKAVLSFDWRRERTQSNSYPPLPSPPLPRLRNYRRAVLFERLSLPGAGIKDVNARHLASLQGKSAGTAFHSGVNLMKRSFHLSRAPL